jgi:FkbM family methyltransferase
VKSRHYKRAKISERKFEARNIVLGSELRSLQFSADQDTVNHILTDGEPTEQIVEAPIRTLDDVLAGREPVVIKIDVEGFETKVLGGAQKTLANPTLRTVIMELNGGGERYGFAEEALHLRMLSFGFEACAYPPDERAFDAMYGKRHMSGNTLYLRKG